MMLTIDLQGRIALVVGGSLGGMVALAGLMGKRIPTSFLPEEDQGYMYAGVQLPDASSLQRTDVAVRQMEKIIMETPRKLNLNCHITGNKVTVKERGGSDHAPFVEKRIPAVSVFSGGAKHMGYHKADDTIYWITPKIMESIAKIVGYTVMRLAAD